MKHSLRCIFRFVVVTAILATVTVLFLRGRDPMFLNSHRPSVGEAALDREIDVLDIDGLPINQAIELISRKAGVRITVAANMFPEDEQPSISLHTSKIDVGSALAELCRKVDGNADYFPTQDGIEVVAAGRGGNQFYLQAYDMRKTISVGPSPQMEAKEEQESYSGTLFVTRSEIEWALTPQFTDDRIPAALLNKTATSGCGVGYAGGWLFSLASFSAQRKLRQFACGVGATPAAQGQDDSSHVDIACLHNGVWIPFGRSQAERDLLQTIPALRAKDEPLNELIGKLERQSKTHIAVDWPFLEAAGVEQSVPVSIARPSGTLASALHDLFLWGAQEQFDIHPNGDIIELGKCESHIRRYDLRRYFARFPPAERRAAANRLKDALGQHPKSPDGYDYIDESALEFVGPYLLVADTWENQQAVAARLRQFLKDESASADLDIPEFVESTTTQPVR